MTTFNIEDIGSILAQIGTSLPSDLNPSAFVDFGKMTSTIYRQKFFDLIKMCMDKNKVTLTSVGTIIYFATLIKNKKRILDGLTAMSATYGTTTWFKEAVWFYQNMCVQYVSEAEKTGKFPVVNIPGCMPNLAAHYFKIQLKEDGKARTDAAMFKAFSENLWFCQLRITTDLLNNHKLWETNFWNNTVKKSKNPDAQRYINERGFQEAYYTTKSEDDYRFIVNGKESDTTMDEAAIIAWLKA